MQEFSTLTPWWISSPLEILTDQPPSLGGTRKSPRGVFCLIQPASPERRCYSNPGALIRVLRMGHRFPGNHQVIMVSGFCLCLFRFLLFGSREVRHDPLSLSEKSVGEFLEIVERKHSQRPNTRNLDADVNWSSQKECSLVDHDLSLRGIEQIILRVLGTRCREPLTDHRETDLIRWVVRRCAIVSQPCRDGQTAQIEHLPGARISEVPRGDHTTGPGLIAHDTDAVNGGVKATSLGESIGILA